MSKNDIANMSVAQKMELMEEIWNSFDNDEMLVSPSWHEDTLENRERDIKNNTAHFSELSEVKERLADRLESK
jgi:hypothetical protein